MRHIAKRIVAVVLTMMMVLSLVSWASAADYADMPTNWAKEPMEAAVENGLLQGNNGLLNPGGNLTRAQMAAIVVRAFGVNYYDNLEDFTDVKDTDWFVKDNTLGAAYIMGLFQGNGDGRLTPNTAITREAAFAVLARALKLEAGTAEDLAKFSDANEVSSWFVGEVAAMAKAGYVNGNDGKLNPKGNITRAQFAQVMFNIFGDYVKEEGTVTEIGGKSVVISANGVTLKDVNVKGDVIVGEGVAEGDVYLDNVKIDGRLLVRGGGINSVHIIGGSEVADVIVAKVMTDVRIVTDGEATAVGTITVVEANSNEDIKDGNVIIEGAAEAVVANSTSTIKLDNAKVETVEINAKTEVTADNSEIGKVTVAAEESYLTLTNGSSADEVVVAEAAKDAVVNVDDGTTIGKLETSANITVAGSGTVEEEVANGEAEIKKEAEVVERPEEDAGDTRVHVHDKVGNSYVPFDDKEHYYICAVTKDGAPCGEVIYEAHTWEDSKWIATYKDGHTGTEVSSKPAVGTAEEIAAGAAATTIVSFVVSEQTCSACSETKAMAYSEVALGTVTDSSAQYICTNHNWVAMTSGELTAATKENHDVTCTVDGVVWYKCSNTDGDKACISLKSETTPATGHRFDKRDAAASSAPTCKDNGADVYVCINPGCCVTSHDHTADDHVATPATKSITLTATGNHDFTKVVKSADGNGHKIQCSTEGCTQKKQNAEGNADLVVDCTIALRTIWKKDAEVVTTEPADTTGWTKVENAAYCTVCGWQSASAHAHDYTASYKQNPNATGANDVHIGVCACGATEVAATAHSYNTTQEAQPEYLTGKCKICGANHAHGSSTQYTYTAGTKTSEAAGNGIPVTQHGVACKACGYKFSNADHTYNKTAGDGACTVCEAAHDCATANSFTYANIKDESGNATKKHTKTCSICGKVASSEGGDACADTLADDGKCDLCGATVVTKADHTTSHGAYLSETATLKTAGTHVYTCTICGDVEKEEACTYAEAAEGKPATGLCTKCGTAHACGTASTETHTIAPTDAATAEKKRTETHTTTCKTCHKVTTGVACTADEAGTACTLCKGKMGSANTVVTD